MKINSAERPTATTEAKGHRETENKSEQGALASPAQDKLEAQLTRQLIPGSS
jgi:hypothetical protein